MSNKLRFVDPDIILCEDVAWCENYVFAAEGGKVESTRRPTLGFVVERDLLNAEHLSVSGGDMLHSKRLRVIEQEALDEIGREIANVVAPNPGANQTELL